MHVPKQTAQADSHQRQTVRHSDVGYGSPLLHEGLGALQAQPTVPYRELLQMQRQQGNRHVNQVLQQSKSSTPHRQPVVQTKLTIGSTGDRYEQEADRVANQVVQQIHSPHLSDSLSGQTAIQRWEALEENETVLQRKPMVQEHASEILQRQEAIGLGAASTKVKSTINSASGQPLDPSLQQSMGAAMGADLSGVRVHTDTTADQLNQSMHAKAFTVGQDIFFRQGLYDQRSRDGQVLIAHELTHVMQQRGNEVKRQPNLDMGQVRQAASPEAPGLDAPETHLPQVQIQPLTHLQQPTIQCSVLDDIKKYLTEKGLSGKISADTINSLGVVSALVNIEKIGGAALATSILGYAGGIVGLLVAIAGTYQVKLLIEDLKRAEPNMDFAEFLALDVQAGMNFISGSYAFLSLLASVIGGAEAAAMIIGLISVGTWGAAELGNIFGQIVALHKGLERRGKYLAILSIGKSILEVGGAAALTICIAASSGTVATALSLAVAGTGTALGICVGIGNLIGKTRSGETFDVENPESDIEIVVIDQPMSEDYSSEASVEDAIRNAVEDPDRRQREIERIYSILMQKGIRPARKIGGRRYPEPKRR